ncbi:MAG: pyridine nucleotide transhydrogenase [Gemmataceae bacterium]|nr:pyridine nucleotide transhydrogenase [Gemmataceae bacterium]
MPNALIGHTGFVGGNLAAQYRFDTWFNSKNIEAVRGKRFGLLVVSAMPAAMWVANQDADADRGVLNRLWGCLSACRAETVVIVSTVAVYPTPVGVDEDTPIDPAAQTPYGRHRLQLEQLAAEHFPRVLSVRLPGLYGPGLKKNAVYDLLHDHEVHKIPADAVYQFYNLNRLSRDVQTALAAGLSLVNLATEPVSVREVAREAFGVEFLNDPGVPPPRYDVRTNHAAAFGGHDGYLETRGQVLAGLKAFVAAERGRLRPLAVA